MNTRKEIKKAGRVVKPKSLLVLRLKVVKVCGCSVCDDGCSMCKRAFEDGVCGLKFKLN